MRASEILRETVTFWIPDAPARKEKLQCGGCDGTGEDNFNTDDDKCPYCKGKGYDGMTTVSDAPEMNLANSNARSILNILGLDADENLMGEIKNSDIGNIKQRIMKIINSDNSTSEVERSPSDIQQTSTTVGKDEHGLSQIQRQQGPHMVDYGLSGDDIKKRLKYLITVLDYAQKNNYNITYS